MKQVVEPDVDRFEVEGPGFVGRGNEQERDVLFECSAGQNVQAAQVEAVVVILRLTGTPAGGVDCTLLVLSRLQNGVMRKVIGQ